MERAHGRGRLPPAHPARSPPAAFRTRVVALTALRSLLLGALAAGAALLAAGPAGALPYVAIDPGHGDRDSGAVGLLSPGVVTGLTPRTDAQGRPVIFEKDVNLDISLRLDRYLRARGGRTLLTRTQDLAGGDRPYTTVRADLKARTDMANEAGVDVFVSVHNNALGPTTTGTETFAYYSAGPAARALAQHVHTAVVARLGLPDRGVKTGGFYVLRATVMPAVLVEAAFLSNPAEAALLAQPPTRQAIAEAIGAGVESWTASGGLTMPGQPVARKPVAVRRPTIGPWRTRPRAVPRGYRLVKTGRANPVGRGGWLAVRVGYRAS